jgi:hypothetical protein
MASRRAPRCARSISSASEYVFVWVTAARTARNAGVATRRSTTSHIFGAFRSPLPEEIDPGQVEHLVASSVQHGLQHE